MKDEFVTPAVVGAWVGYLDANFCNYKAAWRAMASDYKRGVAIGDVDWRIFWAADPYLSQHPFIPERIAGNMPLPKGWSYCNFRRNVAKAKMKAAQ